MISWFVHNRVAANLLLLIIVVGGAANLTTMPRQLFPEFQLDMVTVRVPFPGSTPSENEESICKPIEEVIQDLKGIKKITSVASEGFGQVNVEVEAGRDTNLLLDEIKSRVDTIQLFPEDAEEPIVEKLTPRQDILVLSLFGQVDERTLKELAERWRDELLNFDGITQVRIEGVRDYEISVELSQIQMRRYGLTFGNVMQAIQDTSVDLPAGQIRSPGGKVLLRTKGKAYTGEAFSHVPIRTAEDGTYVTLGDVAAIRDGFREEPIRSEQNGIPAVNLTVQATGNQNVLEIANRVHAFAKENEHTLPTGVEALAWADRAYYLEGRLQMLLENGFAGLVLVFLVLMLFLRPSLAMWVSLGIPISFLGAFFVLGWVGTFSINIVSLFAFIMVLGVVVDDAIIVGESVFTEYQKHGPSKASAIEGTRLVAMPVTFAVLTSAVAFLPVFFIPGTFGNMLEPIPWVVISALLFSLVESKLILPHHLTWCNVGARERENNNAFQRVQRRVSDSMERFVENKFSPALERLLRWRYATTAVFIAALLVVIGLIQGNHLQTNLQPDVPSDYIFGHLTMAEGTPFQRTDSAMERILEAMHEVVGELEAKGIQEPISQVQNVTGMSLTQQGPTGGSTSMATNRGFFVVEMQKSENRSISAPAFAKRWREQVGNIPGADELRFNAFAGGGAGATIDIQIEGNDFDKMAAAANEVKSALKQFPGVYDIRDNFSGGKRELQLQLRPEAETLGITQAELARQVRQAFYGGEAQRVQRGKHEVRIMVRYPIEHRKSLSQIENMRVRLPDGTARPVHEIATLQMGRGNSTITRVDRKRVINVRAEAEETIVNMDALIKKMEEEIMPGITEGNPELGWSLEGETRQERESSAALTRSGILILFLIYTLMAIPLSSYLQPLIVMAVIPFGLIGAAFGHLFFDMSMNMLSMLGLLALAGVLVNDSLVLVDFINQRVKSGMAQLEAVRNASAARFRPIILTSLTTVLGLTPILLEQSLQAQFLIPMALSLAFGLAFGTVITLILVPSTYLMLEDLRRLWLRLVGRS